MSDYLKLFIDRKEMFLLTLTEYLPFLPLWVMSPTCFTAVFYLLELNRFANLPFIDYCCKWNNIAYYYCFVSNSKKKKKKTACLAKATIIVKWEKTLWPIFINWYKWNLFRRSSNGWVNYLIHLNKHIFRAFRVIHVSIFIPQTQCEWKKSRHSRTTKISVLKQ